MRKLILLAIIISNYGTALPQVQNMKNESTAEELYEKAFDYMYGRNGVIMDSIKAVELFEQSANMGLAKAQVERACVEKSDSAALKWLLKAAAQDCHFAMRPLFGIYYNGRNDVPKNNEEAYKWLKKGAELGNSWCQWLWGYTLHYGDDGFPVNVNQAIYWLGKAAEQNQVDAVMELAGMYEDGKLVKRDIQKANELYRKAAELGDPEGAYNYAYAYWVGDGVNIDKETAFKWMKKAAESGYIQAQINLAYFFATSYGCEKNETAARYWWNLVSKNEKASEKDRKKAQYNISLLDQHIEIK